MLARAVSLLILAVLALLSPPDLASARTWRITPDGTGDAPTIQAGIDSACHYDLVVVAPGTYHEAIDFQGKKITVASYFLTSQDTSYIAQTVIDAANTWRSVVTFENAEDRSAVLCGLTLTHGNGTWYGYHFGGGIFCRAASPTLSDLVIEDCMFVGPDEFGGGIACLGNSVPLIEGARIQNNGAGEGGGIQCEGQGADPVIRNSTVCGNSAHWGAGISAYGGAQPVLERVLICDNTLADNSGGWGIAIASGSSAILVNVTLAGNEGGGLHLVDGGNAFLVDGIVWGNDLHQVRFHPAYAPSSIVVAYSDIAGGEAGIETNGNGVVHWQAGNIDADPLFLQPAAGSYRLTPASPCIDAGVAYFEWNGEVVVDLAPEQYSGSAPDMGACEFTQELTSVQDAVPLASLLLQQNHPNPFNPSTIIRFALPRSQLVQLGVYAVDGRHVTTLLDRECRAGWHTTTWDGSDDRGRAASAGVYLYRLQAAGGVQTKKMTLAR